MPQDVALGSANYAVLSTTTMSIRIGPLAFPLKSAKLHYTRVPNGTIEVYLEIVGEDLPNQRAPHLTLDPPPLPGRALTDLTGQVQAIISPTKPDRYHPRAVNVVAGIYVSSHEDVYDSRVEWGSVDDRGISLRWTGTVDDLDRYDGTAPRQPLVAEVHASATETPHEAVIWLMTCAEEDESAPLHDIKSPVVTRLAADLAKTRWFDGLPFVALELVVQVEAKDRRWPALPLRDPGERQVIIAKIPRAVVMSRDPIALRQAIEAEVAAGLDRLNRRYRQGTPRFLV